MSISSVLQTVVLLIPALQARRCGHFKVLFNYIRTDNHPYPNPAQIDLKLCPGTMFTITSYDSSTDCSGYGDDHGGNYVSADFECPKLTQFTGFDDSESAYGPYVSFMAATSSAEKMLPTRTVPWVLMSVMVLWFMRRA